MDHDNRNRTLSGPAGRTDKFSKYCRKIEESTKWWATDSDEYLAIKNKMREIEGQKKEISEIKELDWRDENPGDYDFELFCQRQDLMGGLDNLRFELVKACDAYIANHQGKRFTSAGEERLKTVKKLRKETLAQWKNNDDFQLPHDYFIRLYPYFNELSEELDRSVKSYGTDSEEYTEMREGLNGMLVWDTFYNDPNRLLELNNACNRYIDTHPGYRFTDVGRVRLKCAMKIKSFLSIYFEVMEKQRQEEEKRRQEEERRNYWLREIEKQLENPPNDPEVELYKAIEEERDIQEEIKRMGIPVTNFAAVGIPDFLRVSDHFNSIIQVLFNHSKFRAKLFGKSWEDLMVNSTVTSIKRFMLAMLKGEDFENIELVMIQQKLMHMRSVNNLVWNLPYELQCGFYSANSDEVKDGVLNTTSYVTKKEFDKLQAILLNYLGEEIICELKVINPHTPFCRWFYLVGCRASNDEVGYSYIKDTSHEKWYRICNEEVKEVGWDDVLRDKDSITELLYSC